MTFVPFSHSFCRWWSGRRGSMSATGVSPSSRTVSSWSPDSGRRSISAYRSPIAVEDFGGLQVAEDRQRACLLVRSVGVRRSARCHPEPTPHRRSAHPSVRGSHHRVRHVGEPARPLADPCRLSSPPRQPPDNLSRASDASPPSARSARPSVTTGGCRRPVRTRAQLSVALSTSRSSRPRSGDRVRKPTSFALPPRIGCDTRASPGALTSRTELVLHPCPGCVRRAHCENRAPSATTKGTNPCVRA